VEPDQVHLETELKTPHDLPPDMLSVDVEDYYHVEAFVDCVSQSSWLEFPSRVRANTKRILKIFDEFGCRATFFVLGWVAEQEPALVREIVEAGHEVACHSYSHRRVSTLTPSEFREDLRRARAAIENAGGVRIVGYRAPTFSIGRDNLWALEILSEEGFLYDSSIFPIRHDLYGFPGAPRFPNRLQFGSKRILYEIPMTTVRMGGMAWPAGGGGYLRLLPMSYTRWAVRQIHEKECQSFMVYVHPWELDPDQPRIAGSWKSRLRHYTGLRTMEKRLRQLLANGRFMPLIDLVRRLEAAKETPKQTSAVPEFNLPSEELKI
jgi:polysaccharide deacetylase family protein (PEP-CTERM system associated)